MSHVIQLFKSFLSFFQYRRINLTVRRKGNQLRRLDFITKDVLKRKRKSKGRRSSHREKYFQIIDFVLLSCVISNKDNNGITP